VETRCHITTLFSVSQLVAWRECVLKNYHSDSKTSYQTTCF